MSVKEAVKVIVRCRPMNEREKKMGCKSSVGVNNERGQIQITKPNDPEAQKNFTFDGSYGIDSDTSQIYDNIAYDLIDGVIEGYNGTIFAYGQTGCGKSFTMQGIDSQRGIIPRAFQQIFESCSVVTDGTKFLVRASYLEIYNEDIRDLLGNDIKNKLELKENPDRGVFVKGITNHQVKSVRECEDLMNKGWKNRSTGETLMNKDSSRSHSIFTIHVEAAEQIEGAKDKIRAGKLNLVDLAGSERQSKTGATGARLKEASKINLSLSALGNVISALVDGKSKHIPYRDSKLTRMLQDSLGGNTKTLMIACVSPADNNYDETLSTLRYANRAKNIQNKPKINEDPKDALLRQYQDEILKLKAMLEGNPQVSSALKPAESSSSDFDLNEEKEKIRAELRAEFEKELQIMKEKSEKEIQSNLENSTDKEISNGKQTEHFEQDIEEKVLQKLQEKLHMETVPLENEDVSEIRERKKRRKKHADEMKKKSRQLNEEDDDALITVYENINDKIRHQSVVIDRQKQKITNYKSEINDLNAEFQSDREMYLESIRRQEMDILLLQAMLDKVQPTIRRDCNYSQLYKIKDQSQWDGDKWILPQMKLVKNNLPDLNGKVEYTQTNYRDRHRKKSSPSNDDYREVERNRSEEKLESFRNESPPKARPRPFKLAPLK